MSYQWTWHYQLKKEMDRRGDDFDNIVRLFVEVKSLLDVTQQVITSTTIDSLLLARLDDKTIRFTAWGAKYVYFPMEYDGDYWVGSAPRDPCDEATATMRYYPQT
jgi:hypothetical protein